MSSPREAVPVYNVSMSVEMSIANVMLSWRRKAESARLVLRYEQPER